MRGGTHAGRALVLAAVAWLAGCAEPVSTPPSVPPDWPPMLADIVARAAQRFDVPALSVAESDALPPDAPLLDVRTAQEASVSRIAGALLLPDDATRDAWLLDPPAGPVLVTCAAGWRSAAYAERLRAAGVEAYNLEGGVYAWAAAGRELVDALGRPTRRVHGYDDTWAKAVPASHEVVLEPRVP